ncbi:MAG TPA: hypothetical protein VMU94_31425 [Streptosporangiaceae bacterium]|nr:hypothetical protein [Streptosporangiaceae bacterium]
MDLRPYIENIQRQLAVAAEAGGEEARVLAGRLFAPLEAAVRLTLQDVLAVAAEEITCELAPGSVELRLRGRDPEFVVTPPPAGPPSGGQDDDADEAPDGWPSVMTPPDTADRDDGAMSRINLRMPDHLKARVDGAASRDGVSVNAWLVRAAATALERADPGRGRGRRAASGAQRYRGWVR